jgi:ribosomal subunit interface protein
VRIEIRGRNTPITDSIREHIEERFNTRIGKQVSELAQLEIELLVERNPSIAESKVAEATLHLKGVTLRARSGRYASSHCRRRHIQSFMPMSRSVTTNTGVWNRSVRSKACTIR